MTGGGRGIGRALAEALAAAGAAVTVTARSVDQLEQTVAAIRAEGGAALALPADVTSRVAVEAVVHGTQAHFGPITLLVNNAGGAAGPGTTLGPLWELDPEDWWREVELNLRSSFLCSWAVLPAMVARGGGRIMGSPDDWENILR